VVEADAAAAVHRRVAPVGRGSEEACGLADTAFFERERRDELEEAAEHVIHDGHEQVVAIAKVDVKGAAREAGARADPVEAGAFDAALRELCETRKDERLARGLLLLLSISRLFRRWSSFFRRHPFDIPLRM
jgi:hypothetical protein